MSDKVSREFKIDVRKLKEFLEDKDGGIKVIVYKAVPNKIFFTSGYDEETFGTVSYIFDGVFPLDPNGPDYEVLVDAEDLRKALDFFYEDELIFSLKTDGFVVTGNGYTVIAFYSFNLSLELKDTNFLKGE